MATRHVLTIYPNLRTILSAGVIRICRKTGRILAIKKRHTVAFFHLMYGIYVKADIPFLARDLSIDELLPLFDEDGTNFTTIFKKTYGAKDEDSFFGVHQFTRFVDIWKKCCSSCLTSIPWTIPKGKSIDPESLVDTAKREFFEETGIKFDPADLDTVIHKSFWRDISYKTVYFIDRVDEEITQKPIDRVEIDDISWREKDEIEPKGIFSKISP